MEEFFLRQPKGVSQKKSSFFGTRKYENYDVLRSRKGILLWKIRFPEFFPALKAVWQDIRQVCPKGW